MVKIIVDSSIDVTDEIKEKLTVISMSINFGEEVYFDGITIDRKEFYKKLIESDVLPTTSQATPTYFATAFEEIKKNGDSAVVLTISSELSGTYQSALIAAEEYDNIYIVDTKTTTIGGGVLAEYALSLVEKGLSAKEIADVLNEKKEKIKIIALLETLEYLKKGGRISKSVALVGGVLNIKPVINLVNGVISLLGTARGSKRGNNLLVQEIEKAGGIDFNMPLLLGYTGLSDETLKIYIEDSKHIWEGNVNNLNSTIIGSVVGTHVGPGAIAVAFFSK